MQLWFKPYGTLLDMKKLEKSSDDSVAFVVFLGIPNSGCFKMAVRVFLRVWKCTNYKGPYTHTHFFKDTSPTVIGFIELLECNSIYLFFNWG